MPRGMLNKISFHGFSNSLGAVIYPQPIEGMSQILLNGRLTNAELGTNVSAGLASCNQPQYLALALREERIATNSAKIGKFGKNLPSERRGQR